MGIHVVHLVEPLGFSLESLVRYLWALPNTLLGLLFLPVAARGGGIALVHGVLELHGPLVAAVLRRVVPIRGGAAAMTFGHVVIARDKRILEVTRAHERVHVRQYECWGPAFIPAYLVASAWAWIRGRGAYEGNYFEREAFRRESRWATLSDMESSVRGIVDNE